MKVVPSTRVKISHAITGLLPVGTVNMRTGLVT